MIGTRHVLSSLAEEFASLERTPSACLRRPALALAALECHACADICPHDAITLGASDAECLSLDEDACDGCGACVEVCPSPALEHASALRRDIFVALAQVTEERRFRVSCPLAEDASAPLRVPCVAGLPWEAGVVALLRGAAGVEVATGACGRCERRALEARVEEVVAACTRAAEALKLGNVVHVVPREVVEEERSPTEDRRVSRRGLFDGLLKRGKRVVERTGAKGVERLARVVEPDAGTEVTVDGLWLRRLMATALRQRQSASEGAELPRVARLSVDAEACSPCPLCAAACPTEALHAKLRMQGSQELSLEPERCTGCEACVVSCPQGAISVEHVTDFSSWGRRRNLITRQPGACLHCGAPSLSSDMPYCARCYREGHAASRLPR